MIFYNSKKTDSVNFSLADLKGHGWHKYHAYRITIADIDNQSLINFLSGLGLESQDDIGINPGTTTITVKRKYRNKDWV